MIKIIRQLFERLHIKGNTLLGVFETVIPKEYQNLIDFIGEFKGYATIFIFYAALAHGMSKNIFLTAKKK